MKTLIKISLALCFVLFISLFSDEKPIDKKINFYDYLKADTTQIKIPGFNFAGLKDSINKHPGAGNNYHTKKLWGYIK